MDNTKKTKNTVKDAMQNYPGKELEAMSFAVNYHRWIINEFESYFGEIVAEVGAGTGSISELLLEKNIKSLSAFEPSQNMYPLLEKTLQKEKRAKAINDFFAGEHIRETFDSVVYINILEHVEEDHVELTNVLTALKPGGYLLLFVPALEWLYSEVDKQMGHVRRYTKNSLVNLVEDVGFTIVKERYFDLLGIIPWYINFVLLRSSFGSRRVALYDNLVVPLMKIVESRIPVPIGKNILIVGKKYNNYELRSC